MTSTNDCQRSWRPRYHRGVRWAWLVIVAACSGARTEVVPHATALHDAAPAQIAADAAPAAPLDARIVQVSAVGGRLVIEVDRGSASGVTVGWLARLIDVWDRAVPGTRAPIVRVTRDTAVFEVAGTQLPPTIAHARLTPP